MMYGIPAMKLSVVYRPSGPASASPYRVLDERGQEIAWANAFLDAQCVRQLSPRSLPTYAYYLLHFARWWGPDRPLSEITQSTLEKVRSLSQSLHPVVLDDAGFEAA